MALGCALNRIPVPMPEPGAVGRAKQIQWGAEKFSDAHSAIVRPSTNRAVIAVESVRAHAFQQHSLRQIKDIFPILAYRLDQQTRGSKLGTTRLRG